MNVVASSSTACYACALVRATVHKSARFSTTIQRTREDNIWKGTKWPEPAVQQTHSLLRELRRLKREDGVQLDKSVFATFKGGKFTQPPEEPETKPHWRQHRESMKEKFPEGWNPPRRLSRGDMNTIRRLHTLDPIQFSTPNLAEQFKISAEAVRRILKSKFRTDEEVEEGKIGDALLEEAELGSYDKSRESSRRSSRRMQEQEPFKPQQWERKTTPAKPLQEGFDASKMSSNYKWAAGRKSQLRVVPHPSFVPRKWEDSKSIRELRETRRARRQGEREPHREEGSESRPVFQQRSW